MKYIVFFLFVILVGACQSDKSAKVTQEVIPVKVIENEIILIEGDLSMGKAVKTYFPPDKRFAEVGYYFKNNDSTHIVKLFAQEVDSLATSVVAYYFSKDTLIHIHDHYYEKRYKGSDREWMQENKYYFHLNKLDVAIRRETETNKGEVPRIETATFKEIKPSEAELQQKIAYIKEIKKKYLSLPFNKKKK